MLYCIRPILNLIQSYSSTIYHVLEIKRLKMFIQQKIRWSIEEGAWATTTEKICQTLWVMSFCTKNWAKHDAGDIAIVCPSGVSSALTFKCLAPWKYTYWKLHCKHPHTYMCSYMNFMKFTSVVYINNFLFKYKISDLIIYFYRSYVPLKCYLY